MFIKDVYFLLDINYVKKLFMLFEALQLTTGSTTVMHLVMREQLPEPNNQGDVIPTVSFSLLVCVNVG